MDGRLHSHGFTELAEGLVRQGKVIVDIEHEDKFTTIEQYDDNHIIVPWEEFTKNNGEVRFVKVN